MRHGETDHNRDKILHGQLDVPLNERGREQARKLAERLSDRELDAIYSSSLARAHETAEIVAEKHSHSPEPIDRLQEINLGELEGEDAEKWFGKMDEMGEEFYDWSPEKGESMRELEKRVRKQIEKFSDQHPEETVLAVAHGGTISTVLMSILEVDRDRLLKFRQENTCVNVIRHEESNGWVVESLNDTCHLD